MRIPQSVQIPDVFEHAKAVQVQVVDVAPSFSGTCYDAFAVRADDGFDSEGERCSGVLMFIPYAEINHFQEVGR